MSTKCRHQTKALAVAAIALVFTIAPWAVAKPGHRPVPDPRLAAAQQAVEAIAYQVEQTLRSGDAKISAGASSSGDDFDLVARTRRLYDRITSHNVVPDETAADTEITGDALAAEMVVRTRHADILPVPSAAARRFAVAAKGTPVLVLDRQTLWFKVLFDNGVIGWVEVSDLTASPADAAGISSDEIVTAALQRRGVPYVWGGTTSRGFDCSGLVFRILQRLGLRPPRTAAEQFSLGQPVARTDLRAGDLVFFKDTYKHGISHVGIYIANNRFVHASSGKGVVTIGNLNASYYVAHYAGARRLFDAPGSGYIDERAERVVNATIGFAR